VAYSLLLAYAVILGGLPRQARAALMTFCSVASNFAVPLALPLFLRRSNESAFYRSAQRIIESL
jgi:ABC-type uncharacterized transport system permease subunit